MGKVDREVIGKYFEHLLGWDDIELLGKEIEPELTADFLNFLTKFGKAFQFSFHVLLPKIPFLF